jgi:hypothetical protein
MMLHPLLIPEDYAPAHTQIKRQEDEIPDNSALDILQNDDTVASGMFQGVDLTMRSI